MFPPTMFIQTTTINILRKLSTHHVYQEDKSRCKCVMVHLFQNDDDGNSEITEDVISDSENNEANSQEEAADTDEHLQVAL